MENPEHAPNCYACALFKTTHDPRAPRGCQKFGFKTKSLPSVEVLTTTGKQCIFFEEKASDSVPSRGCLREGSTISLMG